jgi:hypothetical protein
MDKRRVVVITAVLVLLAVLVAAAIGTAAYQAGIARGLADAGKLPAPEVHGWPYGHHGPRWGGPFGFVVPLLGVLLVLVVARALFRPGWCGGHGAWGSGVPPAFADWHRRAHEGGSESAPRA